MERRLKSLKLNGIVVGKYLGSDDPNEDLEAARDLLRSKGLYNPPSLASSMLGQANAFAYVANESYKRLMSSDDSLKALAASPFVVNAAFSIELYLKTLHNLASTTTGRIHLLVDLFDALPEQERAALQGEAVRLAREHGEGPETSFRNHLEMLNNAFVQWRYVFESPRSGMIHFQRTILVMHACRDFCSRKVNSSGSPAGE